MDKTKESHRYLVLGALFIGVFCLGGAYCWSVFSKPLAAEMGWEYSDVTVAYSLLLVMVAGIGVLGGKLLDRFGPRALMMVAAVMWGGGWILTGFATSLAQLYIFFGLICGFADGLFYNAALSTAQRWFPDKRGLASGLITGSAGIAPLILAPLANAILEQYGVMNAFKIIGVLFLVLRLSTTWIVTNPAPGWKPAGYEPPVVHEAEAAKWDKDWKGMMSDPLFWMLWLAFFGGSVAGIMLTGHASGIGQQVAGMTAAQGALIVGIMAVANFCGRTLMGAVSDKIGRYPTMMIAFAVTAVDMILMSMVSGWIGFLITIIIVAVCFGGTLATFPGITSDAFGLTNIGLNYGIMFTAYGIAAIVGPMAAAKTLAASGSYNGAFILSAVLAVVGLVIIFVASRMMKKRLAVRDAAVNKAA